MIVNRTITPEESWSDEEGDHTCPALVVWQIICPDHQVYTNVTVMEADVIRLHPYTLMNFIDSLKHMAKIDLVEHGCDHDIPLLEVPVFSG